METRGLRFHRTHWKFQAGDVSLRCPGEVSVGVRLEGWRATETRASIIVDMNIGSTLS